MNNLDIQNHQTPPLTNPRTSRGLAAFVTHPHNSLLVLFTCVAVKTFFILFTVLCSSGLLHFWYLFFYFVFIKQVFGNWSSSIIDGLSSDCLCLFRLYSWCRQELLKLCSFNLSEGYIILIIRIGTTVNDSIKYFTWSFWGIIKSCLNVDGWGVLGSICLNGTRGSECFTSSASYTGADASDNTDGAKAGSGIAYGLNGYKPVDLKPLVMLVCVIHINITRHRYV